ncbi:MAG: AAA family ATPase [Vicinamibacterales bacterium]
MRIAKLRIEGFRGIRNGEFVLHQKTAIVGPNGCGKSTIVSDRAIAPSACALILGLLASRYLNGFTTRTPSKSSNPGTSSE